MPHRIFCLILTLSPGLVAEEIVFNRDIRPILSDRCFHCHGPDEEERKGHLRLDRTDGPEGAYRDYKGTIAIQPGSLSNSELWARITSDDRDEVMPPPKSHKKALSDLEKERIKRWIEEGAEYENFWAFETPATPPPPEVRNKEWPRADLDRFVLRDLETKGLKPSPQADRRTLIRRLSFDLTGLPPTPEEIREFLDDQNPDAYARLVDRLMARPHYGEHMAKYWLDLVRFADTNGIHHDHLRDQTPYRDWVIRAFNQNLPYADFTRYQLAGDLYQDPTDDQLVASGFHRLHLIIDVGTALPEESRHRNILDRVESFGTAFLGLTVQCAVCHDHKYDPITMRDFYSLSAFFNNIDAEPETGGRSGSDFTRGVQPPYIYVGSAEDKAQFRELEDRSAKLAGVQKQCGKQLEAAKKKAAGKDATEEDKAELAALEARAKIVAERLQQTKSELAPLQERVRPAMVMKERKELRPAHILIRGAYDNPGEEVARNTPAFLPPLQAKGEVKTRMDLAEWLVAPDHPLTARVTVNRFWQQFFGVGIVKTAEDFGAQGEWPSHPGLLDHLTTSFVASGWDMKALVRRIVMSATYRQSSSASRETYAADPENRLLARGSRFRMDSELIRDQILVSCGLLNREMFGRSVKPPQPAGLWKAVNMPSSYPRDFAADQGDKIYRRSIYTFWKRGMPPPQMTILNAPGREYCIARRERTNTPLQALLLMNEQEYLKAARHLALRLLKDDSTEASARIAQAYEIITSQLPDEVETRHLTGQLEILLDSYRERPELAAKLAEGCDLQQIAPADLAAWTMLVSTIYNLDITKTRQ